MPPPPELQIALHHLRTRRFTACIDTCSTLLLRNPHDQAAWYLKAQALAMLGAGDDADGDFDAAVVGEDGEGSVAIEPRPDTSIPTSTADRARGHRGVDPTMRPVSGAGRVLPGFTSGGASEGARRQLIFHRPSNSLGRAATASSKRGQSSSGRIIRLGTASLAQVSGTANFIDIDRLDLKKYAGKPMLSRDWWWKLQTGKCLHRLGLLRDAEAQFLSSLDDQQMVTPYRNLSHVYMGLDQPLRALEILERAATTFPSSAAITIDRARVLAVMNDLAGSTKFYKMVLQKDSGNVEAMASLASNAFYSDQPEVALRHYRRLLQLSDGSAPELWNNLGLCTFHAQQLDMSLSCFERALACAEAAGDDRAIAAVWYNIGHIGVNVGDLELAYQSFKLAVAADNGYAAAWNNLGVIEQQLTQNAELAKSHFETSTKVGAHLYEPLYNAGGFALAESCFEGDSEEWVEDLTGSVHSRLAAVLHLESGDVQSSFAAATASAAVHPGHEETQVVLARLREYLAAS
ncbi:hypothetical protein BDK51DRAFT_27278 [Blyttiomyces helicus]|uniref:Uncharacterized protein n=1 Tax=Blyttiomyces helicus TaxID=388810 RepID=A0A4P9W8T7_9FUNG|nr:hypothetical protein BDK51DRAFT_27278 [Blyttiomyces helicus]|eukprot:RKO87883.1 hypothetical protein BDK51DRAFT_27278 [Blyttiomyces helicus]